MWWENFFNIFLYGGNIGKMNKAKFATYQNNIAFMNVFVRLLQDALHRYKIDGVPDTCSERVMIQSLLWYGNVVLFDKEDHLISLPGAPSGKGYNAYGDPASAWVWARNGKTNEEVTLYLPGEDESNFLKKTSGYINSTGKSKGVIVWENAVRAPFINQVIWFTEKIADTHRTIDVARRNIKTPWILFGTEETVSTVKAALEKFDNNEERIFSTGSFDPKNVAYFPLAVQSDTISSATCLVEWYENKFREICGIDSNSQQDKKGENLVTAELQVNDEYQEQELDKCLKYIQEGLDYANKLFGTNMKVRANKDEYADKDENLLSNENGENGLSNTNSTGSSGSDK